MQCSALRGRSKRYNIRGKDLEFFPDFTVAVQMVRHEFTAVKKKLQKTGLRYATLYPARLWVDLPDGMKVFTAPHAAMEHIKKLGLGHGASLD
ncbi:hypothetical protein NDU88_004704 [Pleurodeles waltl]|uniref:Uncharacterized protein n=1 Tax=Pleurodeles waltl TaxID=8319 RepID=A0AAV7QGB1_PLEWA|nr:hypothetical protein NDU88_004704 [Pleurodeles waltl]